MTDTDLHSALREWRDQFSGPVPYIVLVSVAVLLTILAPFGTAQVMSWPEAFVHWLITAAGTYSIGAFVTFWLNPKVKSWNKPIRAGSISLAICIAITPFVTTLNFIKFGNVLPLADWFLLVAELFVIALIVTIILDLIGDKSPTEPLPKTASLLERLPLEKRGPLVALSSQDHYTLVQTTKGHELVLIRLADAIREAAPTPGLQVHRSHWVALDHVKSTSREGGKVVLSLTSAQDVPVSRSYLGAVKDAGLMAR